MTSLLHAAGIAAARDTDMLKQASNAPLVPAGLPLTELERAPGESTRYYTASAVDDRGRLSDRTPVKVMAWAPGAPACFESMPRSGVIIVRPGGPDTVTAQGFLRLPAATRYDCGISAGQRLLVMADPDQQLLVLCTPYAVDAMVRTYYPVRLMARDAE